MVSQTYYPAEKIVTFLSVTGHLDKEDDALVITGRSILTERFKVTVSRSTEKPKLKKNQMWNEGLYYLEDHEGHYYLVDVQIGTTIQKRHGEEGDPANSKESETKPIHFSFYDDHGLPAHVFSAIIGSVVSLI